MSARRLAVLKFGGSVLADAGCLPGVCGEVGRWRREGFSVIAVVSAFSGVTDRLVRTDEGIGDAQARAALHGLGELESAARLAIRLQGAGIPASVLTPGGVGLIAEGPALDASPVSLRTSVVNARLAAGEVVVFPGFVALDRVGRPVLLGRGGSDLTALFLAAELFADRCRLVKDVDGLYDRDPAGPGPAAQRYQQATYADALATDGTIVQHKAVRFAEGRGRRFEVGALGGGEGTVIGAPRTVFAVEALAGGGGVGYGDSERGRARVATEVR